MDDDELPDGIRQRGSVFRQPDIPVDGGGWFYVFVGWVGDRVDSIGLGFADLPDFLRPANLAKSIGRPETIEVAFLGSDSYNAYQYEVLLRYPTLKSAIRYSGWIDITQRAEVCIDPSEAMLIRIYLYSPKETGEYMQFPSGAPYASTMDSLGLTQAEFFQLLTDHQRCIPVRADALP